jgi:hypothetical protein
MAKFSFLSAALSFFAIICANSIHQGLEPSKFPSASKGRGDRACAFFVLNPSSLHAQGIPRPWAKLGGLACRNHPATIRCTSKDLCAHLSGSWRRNNKHHGPTLLQGASNDVTSALTGQSNRSTEQETQDNAAYNRGVGGREMDPLHRPIIEKLREVSQIFSTDACH